MITGIILAVIFLLLLCNAVTKKIPGIRSNKRMKNVHKGLGAAFILTAILHLCCTLPLVKQRPMLMYVLGFILLFCGIAEAVLYLLRSRLKSKWLRMHRAVAAVMFICLIVHMTSGIISLKNYKSVIASIQTENIDFSTVENGTYIGECDAGYVYAKVSVKIEDGKLAAVDLLEHRTERGKKAEVIIGTMVKEQKITVDAVSGATNSSKVIEQAVYNAVTKRK